MSLFAHFTGVAMVFRGLSVALLACLPLFAKGAEVSATVTGFASLPAASSYRAPASAPEFNISGKYTGGDAASAEIGVFAGKSKGRLTGMSLPIHGQPRQGYSDLQAMPGNVLWAMTDNGYGARTNSKDAMLVLTRFKMDWRKGGVRALQNVFLRDPLRRMPFPIANEANNPRRYLSGADLDPESFRIIGDTLWIGDEFGPYLIKADRWGRIRKVFDTAFNGNLICSPDHPRFETCKQPVKRSKGFESLAVLPGNRTLLAMLEGPLEGSDLLTLEFDLRKERWTGKSLRYSLENPGHSVGAITALDKDHLLVIERDDLEGTSAFPCKDDEQSQCFPEPAAFKRLYKVRIDRTRGQLVKLNYVDLLKLRDPRKLTGSRQRDGIYAMPFWTIEAVTVSSRKEVIIANDNNFPFSASRHPNRQDANEFVRIDISKL